MEKYIYYGVVLFFIARLILEISISGLYIVIWLLKLNIFFIPLIASLISILILYYVCVYLKEYPAIKPLFLIILTIIYFIVINIVPYNHLSEIYSSVDLGLSYSYIKFIENIFSFIFVLSMYIKYYKIKD